MLFSEEDYAISYTGSDLGSSPRDTRTRFERDWSPRACHERRMRAAFGDDTPLRRRSRTFRPPRSQIDAACSAQQVVFDAGLATRGAPMAARGPAAHVGETAWAE